MEQAAEEPRTRGHRKREKTRNQLIQAGLRVLAQKGDGLTVSDVVQEADVSNGTFYNYFVDRDALIEALGEHLTMSLAAAAAAEALEDPARRFALATTRVLLQASQDPTWARVVLRLISRPGAGIEIARYLREDLDEGRAQGRFESGAEDAILDLITGLVLMTIRRIADGRADGNTVENAVARGLQTLGLPAAEAGKIAAEAAAGESAEPV